MSESAPYGTTPNITGEGKRAQPCGGRQRGDGSSYTLGSLERSALISLAVKSAAITKKQLRCLKVPVQPGTEWFASQPVVIRINAANVQFHVERSTEEIHQKHITEKPSFFRQITGRAGGGQMVRSAK